MPSFLLMYTSLQNKGKKKFTKKNHFKLLFCILILLYISKEFLASNYSFGTTIK